MDAIGVMTFVVYLLTSAAIFSLVTLGLNIQWGYAGLLNIGIIGFYAIGAYVSVYLTHGIGMAGKVLGLGLPFPLAFLGSMAGAAAVAYLLAMPGF